MKILLFIITLIFCLSVKTSCFGQKSKNDGQNNKTVAAQLKDGFEITGTQTPIHLFTRGYLHLTGKIGDSNTTIDINSLPGKLKAYVFCDPLKSINGFKVIYKNGTLKLFNDDWLFTSGIQTIDEMEITVRKNSTFIGFAKADSSHKKVTCVFKEDPAGGYISMHQYNFSYKNNYRNFPVSLSAYVLFADSTDITGKKINAALLNRYDLIRQNYSEVMNKLSFTNLAKYKNVKDYKRYCFNKFITAYKNIITDHFLEDAHESGHSDIYLNPLTSEVLWNDGNYLAIQVIMDYADGNAYPYYDTFIFEYDLKKDRLIEPDTLNGHIHANDNSIQAVIANLEKSNIYDGSESGDKWFLGLPQIAFVVKDGVVLYRTGGNHGIHYFYKYYPREALAPVLK